MALSLKEQFFSKNWVRETGYRVEAIHPPFAREAFEKSCLKSWQRLELKQRLHRAAECVWENLPLSYPNQLSILKKAQKTAGGNHFSEILFPTIVELYGLQDPDRSLQALKFFTPYSSSEFAVRPFIEFHEKQSMAFLEQCARHSDEHVRRWASEGCRPRLPWGKALPRFKKDPSPILPILNLLKDDPSLYVRKSVANNLNDISKDHPDLVLKIGKSWMGNSPNTDWIVKHALRRLLKSGNQKALKLFGTDSIKGLELDKLKLSKKQVLVGDRLKFDFRLSSRKKEASNLRLEYAIDFKKRTKPSGRKVFHLGKKVLEPGETLSISKYHSFKNLSTRIHVPGQHQLHIIVNGVIQKSVKFQVLAKE